MSLSDVPLISVDFINIKTPQLIGIGAGCIVFTITIFVVIYLLYSSGSLSRFVEELKSGHSSSIGSATPCPPQNLFLPRLYDHLIDATKLLPSKPTIPVLEGKKISIREISSSDVEHLVEVSNGTAIFGESDYDPARIWGWIEVALRWSHLQASSRPSKPFPWPSIDVMSFETLFFKSALIDGVNLTICDDVIEKKIGMISVYDNQTSNLSMRLGDLKINTVNFLYLCNLNF